MTTAEASLASRLEAVLFTAGEPVPVKELSNVLQVSQEAVTVSLEQLRSRYEESAAGLRVLVSPEGVQLVTAPTAAAAVEAFVKSGMRERLTPAAAETLAIIAYRGPISRVGIEAIRGVNSTFTLRLLALRGLVVRAPHPQDHRSFVYEVSAEFLRAMGVTRIEALPDYASLHAHAGMSRLVDEALRNPHVTSVGGESGG